MCRFHSFAVICTVFAIISQFFRYSIRYIRFSTWILEIRHVALYFRYYTVDIIH